LKSVFENINLIADSIWLDRLHKCDVKTFARFAESVTFVPPLHNWNIDSIKFHSIVRESWAWSYGCYSSKHKQTEIAPQPTIAAAYKTYRTRARRNKNLLLEMPEVLETAWTEVLTAFTNCRAVTFGFVEDVLLDQNLAPDYPACLRVSSQMTIIPSRNWNTVAHPSFRIALRALSRSETSIQDFALKQPFLVDGGQVTSTVLLDHHLNLKDLRCVTMVPYTKGSSHRNMSERWLWKRQVMSEIKSIASICGSTLETLVFSHIHISVQDLWTPTSISNLRTLHVAESIVPSRYLASLISSPKLDRLILDSIGLDLAADDGDWQPVFDAVRNHPSSIEVMLTRVLLSEDDDEYTYSLSPFRTRAYEEHATSIDEHYGRIIEDTDDPAWADRDLRMYLDSRVEWTNTLDETFHYPY
jgi:hypothetical protein